MKKVFILLLFASLISIQAIAVPLSTEQQQQAERLFVALGCQACHDFDNSGSTLAPSLDRIGLKRTESEILLLLQHTPENNNQKSTFMPSYLSTPLKQRELLSRFLANRK